MAELFTELSNITQSLELHEIEYAVCDGLAPSIHCFPSATFDIDILIRPESLERSFEIAKLLGFDIHGLDMSFKERAVEIRQVSKIDEDSEVLSLDFLLVTPEVEDIWASRQTIDFQGNPMSIVSREGLIRMKELAGRDKDLIDIDRIRHEED